MEVHLDHGSKSVYSKLTITGSKSETNRLLLLQALYPEIRIENCSNSDDSIAMTQALNSSDALVDIHHAGTAMRFLTAYFAIKDGSEVTLTGSSRMQERPIALLVEALEKLGARIEYAKASGYPPLRIYGKKLEGFEVSLPADVSSQYISALLLIAPRLENGLKLRLDGEITSLPYIKMTLSLLEEAGFDADFTGTVITIPKGDSLQRKTITVESDWSSASYWFSIVALSEAARVVLSNYRESSLQGDSVLRSIYSALGVTSSFDGHQLILEKTPSFSLPKSVKFNLIEAPDIAQTIAVTCYGLGVSCDLTGLHTLKIKETDRLLALEKELSKVGATLRVTQESLHLTGQKNFVAGRSIETYNDHRMAMAFAPLSLKFPLKILDAEVVSKSYPSFWDDLQKAGFKLLIK